MEVDVLQYFGGEYIEGHCIKDGQATSFYWVVEVQETGQLMRLISSCQ